MSRLKLLTQERKYTNEGKHLINSLIFGVNMSEVQSRLLQQDDTLTLDKAIAIARSVEATREQMSHIRGEKASQPHVGAICTRQAASG